MPSASSRGDSRSISMWIQDSTVTSWAGRRPGPVARISSRSPARSRRTCTDGWMTTWIAAVLPGQLGGHRVDEERHVVGDDLDHGVPAGPAGGPRRSGCAPAPSPCPAAARPPAPRGTAPPSGCPSPQSRSRPRGPRGGSTRRGRPPWRRRREPASGPPPRRRPRRRWRVWPPGSAGRPSPDRACPVSHLYTCSAWPCELYSVARHCVTKWFTRGLALLRVKLSG